MPRTAMWTRGLIAMLLLACACHEQRTPSPPEGSASAGQEHTRTIADAARICQAIQADREISVGCKVSYIGDTLGMILVFGELSNLQEMARAVAKNVAAPFCAAANDANRRAVVLLFAKEQPVGRYECETHEYHANDRSAEVEAAAREELELALGKCQLIERSSAPLRCMVDAVDGVPALIFAFANEDDAATYQSVTIDEVAAPFCEAVTSVRRPGAVYQLVAGSRARRFSCDEGAWTPWQEIRRAPPTQPTPGTPSPRPQTGWSTVASR